MTLAASASGHTHYMTEDGRAPAVAASSPASHPPHRDEVDPGGRLPLDMVQQMADMGFFSILIPGEYGLGLGVFECLVVKGSHAPG